MPRSIRLLLVHCWHLEMFIISVTSVTVTLPSSIALQMPRPDSFHASHGLKKPHKMKRSGWRKMSTGPFRTRPKRMESAAGVVVIPISEMWKAKRAAVWLSGSTSLVDGHHLEHAASLVPVLPGTRCLTMHLSNAAFGTADIARARLMV